MLLLPTATDDTDRAGFGFSTSSASMHSLSAVTRADTPSILSAAAALSGLTFPYGSIATARLSIIQRITGLPPSTIRRTFVRRMGSFIGADSDPYPLPTPTIV